ncbi:uncharacterized protein LOC134159413 [Pezoporus occidentalis]|uniref:uncharacterized protein LOC134159413 n=1 Tax=Pezoporus occidentalis TaxID=407982 RepID=UPI002F914E93
MSAGGSGPSLAAPSRCRISSERPRFAKHTSNKQGRWSRRGHFADPGAKAAGPPTPSDKKTKDQRGGSARARGDVPVFEDAKCPAGKLPKWAPRCPTLQPSPLLPADPLLAASRHSTVPSLPTALQQSFMDCWALESHQRWLCREKQQGLFSHVSPCRSLLPGPRHHRLCDITAVHPRDTGEHPLVPTVSQRQQPLLADCWDWAWFSRAVAAERTVGPGPTAEMEWEPAPAPAPSLCAPHELGQSADTAAAGPSGQGQTAPCDTAAAATQEERDVQPGSEGHDTVRIPPLSNGSRRPAREFSGLGFPQRLWKILESSEFRSIWWGMGGKCVAINEELFQQEVLGRVFSTQKMNSFLRQLYNYGFTRVHPDSQRSASLPEFLAEEAAASSHSKVLYYHSPSFSRERPQLLEQHKRKAAIKRKAPGAAQEEEEHPSRSADAQPAVPTRASPPAKRRNGALPGPSTARPSPRAAAPTSPEPARAAGRESFIPPNLFFPPPWDTGEHPLVPTVSQRQQPLLADCWDWAWFSRAVAAERTVGPGPTAEMEWEPAPAPAPSLCAPHELGQSADTAAAGPSGQGQTAPCDTAAAATQEERDVQPGSEGHDTVRIPPLSNGSRHPAREFSGLGFPQRLWKILESSEFRSIWWGMGGKCVAINEELFQQEVLGRVFSTQKMNSFLRQLYNYGFTRVHPDSQRSASLPEFLAEEAAASSHSKLLYYYNPSFSRERPQLLEQHKRKAAIKRKAPGAAQEEEEHPSRSADAQPAVPTRASPPAKRRNGALPGPSTARPAPRAAAPTSPEPDRAAGRESFIPPNLRFPPP